MGGRSHIGTDSEHRWGVGGERAIGRIAARQHGVISRAQLLQAGLGRDAIDSRLRSGRVRRVRRGIYLLGPIVSPLAREMAAVLACGDGALLSHRSAASLHRLSPDRAGRAAAQVTVIDRDPGLKPGIEIHRTRRLAPDERGSRHGIAVTTPARTILDLAPQLSNRELEQLVAEAHRRGLAAPAALTRLLARYPRRPGTRALRELLAGTPAFTRSRAERRLLSLIRKAELPQPDVNVPVAGFEVDFHWEPQRLVVEVDGYPFHSSRLDRRRDQARDRELSARGYTVLRFDSDEIRARPEATIAALARATR